MLRCSLLLAFAFSTSLLFGQLDSGSITVTASRSTPVLPDQVVFSVDVTSGLSASLDDVIAALAGSGISVANFNGISSPLLYVVTGSMLPQPTIDWAFTWAFTLPVPISQMKATVASLSNLQQNIGKKNGVLKMSFGVSGTQASTQLLQSQTCSMSDLMSDARAQAQKLASATGFNLGYVMSMSSAGAFSCSLTVQYQLLRIS